MKVLLLTVDFPPEFGGKQTLLYEHFSRFGKGGAAVLAASMKGAREFDAKQGFPIYRIPKTFMNVPMPIHFLKRFPLIKTFPYLIAAIPIVMKEKPSKIIAGQLLPDGIVAYYLHKIFNIPYWVSTYDTIDTEAVLKSAQGKAGMKILAQAEKIIHISRFIGEKLQGFGFPAGKLVLIPPATNPKEFYPKDASALRRKLGLEGKKIILEVSRLDPRKNQEGVIKALPAVMKKIPNAVFVIVGEGPKDAAIRALAEKMNLREKVIFAGAVPEGELIDYYNACDVFIMPSIYIKKEFRSEYGIVFLEANACEKPVIGGSNSGQLEVIENGISGININEESVDEIAAAIIKILTDQALAKKLGKQGRQMVLRDWTWDKRFQQLKEALLSSKN